MATRNPLVLINGVINELPVGDTVLGATGGSGSLTIYPATLDFGISMIASRVFDINIPSAITTNKVIITENTSLIGDEAELDTLILSGHVSNVGNVRVFATTTGPIVGLRYINIILG